MWNFLLIFISLEIIFRAKYFSREMNRGISALYLTFRHHKNIVLCSYYRIFVIGSNIQKVQKVQKTNDIDAKTHSPAGKIAEKAMWKSVFLTISHRILNAVSTKTPSSSVTFKRFRRLGDMYYCAIRTVHIRSSD